MASRFWSVCFSVSVSLLFCRAASGAFLPGDNGFVLGLFVNDPDILIYKFFVGDGFMMSCSHLFVRCILICLPVMA